MSSFSDFVYWMQSLDRTDRVIINLKVIAMLQDGQRLCIRNNQFSVWEPGWTQALLRWGFGENRWVNMEEVQTVIHDALRLLGTYMNLVQHAYGATPAGTDKYSIAVPTPAASLGFVSTLSRDLESATSGLMSLRRTYADDPLMVATLDVLIERTQGEIEKAKQLLATMSPVKPASASSSPVLNPQPMPMPMHMPMPMQMQMQMPPNMPMPVPIVPASASAHLQASAESSSSSPVLSLSATSHAHAHALAPASLSMHEGTNSSVGVGGGGTATGTSASASQNKKVKSTLP